MTIDPRLIDHRHLYVESVDPALNAALDWAEANEAAGNLLILAAFVSGATWQREQAREEAERAE